MYLILSFLNLRAFFLIFWVLHASLQRITEDVQKFASAISELYSYTFKPILDIVLFTRSLARTIG
jgi:ABC-type uncharacterized transport system fused permease/ATPase subunit